MNEEDDEEELEHLDLLVKGVLIGNQLDEDEGVEISLSLKCFSLRLDKLLFQSLHELLWFFFRFIKFVFFNLS